jgi:hypothetical protein
MKARFLNFSQNTSDLNKIVVSLFKTSSGLYILDGVYVKENISGNKEHLYNIEDLEELKGFIVRNIKGKSTYKTTKGFINRLKKEL